MFSANNRAGCVLDETKLEGVQVMASASSSSAKNLFNDSKRRLADRVVGTVNNVASVGRQIVRGSRSNDVCIRNFVNSSFVLKLSYC